jgi:MOSC domain-containing protein YiiM
MVEQIAITADPDVIPASVPAVGAHPVHGLDGEYHDDLTLIAAEALEGLRADTGIELSHEASRRNVLTRGVDLNALVGRRFAVGEVECEGMELAEPCRKLARNTHDGVLRGLVHRGGLRAEIVAGGEIRVGDAVRAL